MISFLNKVKIILLGIKVPSKIEFKTISILFNLFLYEVKDTIIFGL